MTTSTNSPRIGLVLSGGGSRAAYQAGVLQAMSEILRDAPPTSVPAARPFHNISGISAGAINACFLATHATDFAGATRAAWALWRDLKMDRILRTGALNDLKLALRWVTQLGLGGWGGKRYRANHLLDSAPLGGLLREILNFDRIGTHLARGDLHGLAISATHYGTGTAVTFFDGAKSIESWRRSTRIGKRSRLSVDHVLASAAIPFLFRPVRIGNSYYGDGSIRLRAPLASAVHMGSDRILAIGIRYPRTSERTEEMQAQSEMSEVSIGEIAGILLNAVFMDGLETDIERLERINRTLGSLREEDRAKMPLRPVPLLCIQPSRDLGTLAAHQFERYPLTLRHLMKGIGVSNEAGWDLISYLAFDSSYTTPLLELGYADAWARKAEILDFFR